MKKKVLKRKLKQQITKLLKEQEQGTNPFKASDNDPSTTCSGRGICCIHPESNERKKAKFILDKWSKKVTCKCPEGFFKITCEK